jgi:hypothetical protein
MIASLCGRVGYTRLVSRSSKLWLALGAQEEGVAIFPCPCVSQSSPPLPAQAHSIYVCICRCGADRITCVLDRAAVPIPLSGAVSDYLSVVADLCWLVHLNQAEAGLSRVQGMLVIQVKMFRPNGKAVDDFR